MIAVLAAVLFTTACSRVSAGYVGIKSTYAGTGKGMSELTVGPGWAFYNPLTESVFEYPRFVQTAVWTKAVTEGKPVNEEITFNVKEKLSIAVDLSIGYTLDPNKVAAFYMRFRNDDLTMFTHGYLRNLAREKFDQIAGKYSVDDVMGDNAPFLAEVRKALQDELTPIGVQINQFGFTSSPRPPAEVIASIIGKVTATQLAQQKQNELVQVEADAKKVVAQAEGRAKATLLEAEAQAEANRKLTGSITPLLLQYEVVKGWNGALPQVQTGSAGSLIQLPSVK